jgi:acyl-CoA hydrolase
MDEVAFICATRFSRKKVVTISTGQIDFKKAIPAGTLIELVAKVMSVGRTSCKIHVDIFMEQMYSELRETVVSGTFSFVAVDENKTPVPILDDLEL